MKVYQDDIVDTNGLYTFIDSPEGDQMYIQIIKGEFNGVVYKYGKVGFKPDEPEEGDETGRLTLVFDYDIISVPESLKDVDLGPDNHTYFENTLGDILVELLERDLEQKKNAIGTNDTQASS